MLDGAEFDRWYATARDALDGVDHQVERGSFHWACFLAEQAAQFGLKGLLHGLGQPGWGHDLPDLGRRLAEATGEPLSEEAADALARLSRHYIATRYPDAHPSGTPAGHFRRADADRARHDARIVLDLVWDIWERAVAASDRADDAR